MSADPIISPPGSEQELPQQLNQAPQKKASSIGYGLAGLAALGKLGVFKILLPLLKTFLSMFIMIGTYTMQYGWKFALGFVLLLFTHEMGHFFAARYCGVPVSTPLFIPFVGALIAMKELPKNVWTEAKIAIAGPILGTVGAVLCIIASFVIYSTNKSQVDLADLLLALGYCGLLLNLFNLTPIGFLDGGRITKALTPWLWIPGLVILIYFMMQSSSFNPVLIFILLFSIPDLYFLLFKKKTPEELEYLKIKTWQKWTISIAYILLVGFLTIGMFLLGNHN
jgi:Zn-dependent protease